MASFVEISSPICSCGLNETK